MIASLLLAFVFLSGALATIGPEITWLVEPQARAPSHAKVVPVPVGRIYDSVLAAYPDARIISIERREEPWFADKTVLRTDGRILRAWTDPASGAILGAASGPDIALALNALHSRLLVPGGPGRWLVTALGPVLVVLIVTGLLSYPRFWRGFLRWPRFWARPAVWLADTHRLVALWSAAFLILMSATSLVFLLEVLGLNTPMPAPRAGEMRAEVLPSGFSGADLERAAAAVHATMPDLTIASVQLPRSPKDGIQFLGHATAMTALPNANRVTVDPATITVLGAHRAEELSTMPRLTTAAGSLHFGEWGGFASRLVWCLFGLLSTVLALVGAALYASRLFARTAKG